MDWRVKAVFLDYFFFMLLLAFVAWVIGVVVAIGRALRWGWRYLMARRKGEAGGDDDDDPFRYGA